MGAWERLRIAYEAQQRVSGRVTEVVKGGLIIDLGVRGFLPASLVELHRVDSLEQYVDRTLEGVIIEFDPDRANLILSRRIVLEMDGGRLADEFFAGARVGELRQAVVVSVRVRGVDVSIDGVSTFIRDNSLAKPPNAHVVGETVGVTICDVDPEARSLVVSTRIHESELNAQRASAFIANGLIEQGDERFAIVQGVLSLETPIDEIALGCVLERASALGLRQVEVSVGDATSKRALRHALGSGSLNVVEATRCRQTETGFVIALRGGNR